MAQGNDTYSPGIMQHPIIKIDHVSAGYDNKVQIDNISLDIMPNDFLAITGPNGGGKTTLVRVIVGLLKPMSGTITYYGSKQSTNTPKIGYLPQYSSIDKDFPIEVIDIVLSGLLPKKPRFRDYTPQQYQLAQDTLNQMNLGALSHHPIKALSGGELQRVLLARAIISQPEILVLDEPNTYIDTKYQDQMYLMLKEINKQCTIIIVTHDTDTVKQYANRIIKIDNRIQS